MCSHVWNRGGPREGSVRNKKVIEAKKSIKETSGVLSPKLRVKNSAVKRARIASARGEQLRC